MAGEQLSLQDGMRRRRRGGAFVGRRDELAVFLANLDTDPGDEAHHFLFHVHGPGGVGKSTLLARLGQEARARGALTATADEDAMTVPAAMAAVAADLAGQDRPLKAFDRLYAVYQQRRWEADAMGAAGTAPPSAGSTVVAQAGLAGLGLVPGLSLVAGAVDPGRVAEGVDRLRAAGSSRFRHEQDLQLLLDPVAALSPVFTADLASAAASARWLTLFFDTYERTGPVLDGWVRELFVDGRYGALPANVVVTLAGQGALDRAGWADYLDVVTPLPLGPFSEAEARQLLAAKGVTDEAVVEVVLRLTDRLPLLVSTLAATRPSGPEAVGDPADTAVERFLAWERDPAGRAAALAAALPLQLDEDVYRVAVGGDVPAAADRYDWLLGLPFVDGTGRYARYHDIVRGQMLRLSRTRSPQRWRDRHERLAAAYGNWRERAARGRSGGELWADETWREHRLHETYHLLCADPRAALPDALLHLARACTAGAETARRWIRMFAAAAADSDAPEPARWSRSLTAIYGSPAEAAAPRPTVPTARRPEPALPAGRGAPADGAAGDAAPAEAAAAHRRAASGSGGEAAVGGDASDVHVPAGDGGAGASGGVGGDLAAGGGAGASGGGVGVGADLAGGGGARVGDRGTGVAGGVGGDLATGGDARVGDGGTGVAGGASAGGGAGASGGGVGVGADPAAGGGAPGGGAARGHGVVAVAARGGFVGEGERAVAAVSVILEQGGLDRERRAVVHAIRGWAQRQAGRPEAGLADYDRAERLGLGTFRLYSERGATHWTSGRPEQAAADYARALAADPADPQAPTVRAQRGGALLQAGRLAEAMAELDAAVAADPGGGGAALVFRAMALLQLDRPSEALADVEDCIAAAAPGADTLALRGLVRQRLGSNEQALTDFDASLARRPDAAAWVLTGRGLALEALGRYAEAADSFTRAVEQGGAADIDTLTHSARLLRLAGRSEQALAAADRACAQDPGSAAAARERALALVAAGRLAEAADAFEGLLALEPGAEDALIALARIHVLVGRPDAALADLDRLAETEPAPSWLAGRRAQLLVLAGDVAGARAVLGEAGPHTLDDLLTLAVCHREEGRYADAAAALDRADALAPGQGGVALERALLTALADGFPAARPRWLALRAAGEPEGITPEVWRTMVAGGLGRWDDAAVHLAALLAADAPWPVRAVLARDLAALAAAPSAPDGAAAPLLARLRATL